MAGVSTVHGEHRKPGAKRSNSAEAADVMAYFA
jgi:hypothetical protein